MPFQAPQADDVDADDEGGAALFAEINITPLTDVILVLLIIFMVSSSAMVDAMREGMLDVSLPSASNAASAQGQSDTLIVGITADGRIFVKDEAMGEDRLREVLAETKARSPQTLVVVQADGDLQHRKVVEIIDLLRGAGFQNVGIAAETGGGK